MVSTRKPHARDTPGHIWCRDGHHWTPRAEYEKTMAMSDRELRMWYFRWQRETHTAEKRSQQID